MLSAFLLLPFFAIHSVARRLDCLQNELGKELNGTSWSWQSIINEDSQEARLGWVYNNSQCPLKIFNEKEFCQKAVGCGKKLLLVGDSTVQRMANSLHYLLDVHITRSDCPTQNGCHTNSPRAPSKILHGCINGGHIEPMLDIRTCRKYCPAKEEVQIMYIRHDYIHGTHGLNYYRSCLCEHWQVVAHKFDYLFVSIGPHVKQMTKYPYGMAPEPNFNETSFFMTEANETAHFLEVVANQKAHIVFRTGPVGIGEYRTKCDVRPFDSPPVLYNNHSWPLIPVLNEIYIDTMRRVLGSRLLIMDTMTLMSKMHGCRTDPMHFNDKTPHSPVLLEWLILLNLLIEKHHVDSLQ